MVKEKYTKRIRPNEIPRVVSTTFWLTIAAFTALSLFIFRPTPYVFHVSELTFDAWEEKDGVSIPLDDYQTGYSRLAVFERYRFLSILFAGILGGSSVHLISSLMNGRDMSILSLGLASSCSLIGILLADSLLPPIVDPVYGESGLRFPWWLVTLIPSITLTLMIGAPIFLLRFLIGICFTSREPMGLLKNLV